MSIRRAAAAWHLVRQCTGRLTALRPLAYARPTRNSLTSGFVMTTIVLDHTFEAAHRLPHVPPGHPCGRMHGHSYTFEVHVRGPIDARTGWVVDFGEIMAATKPLVAQLDHHCLNDIDGLSNPTVEHLAAWLWQKLAPNLQGLHCVVVHESRYARCIYTGPREQ